MAYSIKLPTGEVLGNIPDNVSQQEAFNLATNYMKDKEVQDASFLGQSARAVGRGVLSTGALLVEGMPALFKAGMQELTGDTSWGSEEQTEKLVNALNKINSDPKLKAAVGSLEDVKDARTAALFLTNAFQAAPDLVGTLGAGALAKGGAKALVKNIGKKGLVTAEVAGMAGYNQAMMTPSELASIYAETGEVAPGAAITSAAIQNVGETLSDKFLVGKLGGEATGPLLKRTLKGAAEGAVVEGITEGAQGLVSEAAQEYVNPEKATFDGMGVAEQAILGGVFGGVVKGGLSALPQGTSTDTDKKPVNPNDVLSTEEVAENPAENTTTPAEVVGSQPVQEETKAANKAAENTPEQQFADLFKPKVKKEVLDSVKPTPTPIGEHLGAEPKAARPAPKHTLGGLKKDSSGSIIMAPQVKAPVAPVFKATDVSVPMPVELDSPKNKVDTITKLPQNVAKTFQQAKDKARQDYLISRKADSVSKLNKVQKAEVNEAMKQAGKDAEDSYVNGQLEQSVLNVAPAVRARFDNAKNGQQKTYAKMVNDFADLVGLNMPLAVMFKDGDQKKLDSVPWDETTKQRMDSLRNSVDGESVGRGGILNSQNPDLPQIATIAIDTTTLKQPQDIVQILAHELGHVIDFAMMKNNPDLAKAVNDAWLADVAPKAKTGVKGKDFFLNNSSLSFMQNGDNSLTPTSVMGRPSIKPDSRLFESVNGIEGTTPSEYRLSRNEWVAEQIARWFQTADAPVSVVDKYFKWIADVYRRFFQSLKDQGFYPNDTINDIMNRFVIQAKADVKVAKMKQGTREEAMGELRLYHASPYKFNEFSTDKINSGEGSQYEGWGLYFASIKDVAKWYHEMFAKSSRAKGSLRLKTRLMDLDSASDVPVLLNSLPLQPDERNALRVYAGLKFTWEGVTPAKITNKGQREMYVKGEQIFKKLGGSEERTNALTPQLYKVDVDVEETKMLQWDKPFEEQTDFIKAALAKEYKEHFGGMSGVKGSELYRTLTNYNFKEKPSDTSKYMNTLGIPGIKYKDADSRSTEAGHESHNYVVFNDGAIKIQETFDNPDSFMESGDARRKPAPKVTKPNKQEAKQMYKAQFTPDNITHDQSLGSLTGETEGTFTATDSKGNIMGQIDYVRELVNGKLQTTISGMKLNGKNQRHKQDTAFALLNQMHKDSSINDNINSVESMRPYKEAFDRLNNVPVAPTVKEDTRPEPKLSDVKRVPIFEKMTLPSTPTVVQNFFKKLPNAWVNQTPVVSAVLTRDSSRVNEGKQAYKYPEPFGLTMEDKKTLTEQRNNIAKFVSDTYFQGSDLQHVKALTTSDLVGHAYDAYTEAKAQGKLKFESNLTDPVIKVFDKLDANANDIKLGLNGTGVTKTSDVYYIPTTFQAVDLDNMIQSSVHEMERQDNLSNVEKQRAYDDVRKIKVGPGKISGAFTGVLNWFNPVTNAAKNSPFIGFIQDIAIARRDYGFRLQSKLMHMLEPVLQKHGETTFNGLVGVLESNRLNNFKGYVDETGGFVYMDANGKKRRVTNKQQVESIEQMRGIFNSILNERRRVDLAHRSTQALLRNVGLGLNPSVAQINHLLAKNDAKLTEAQTDSLKNLSRYLKQLDDLQNGRDYVPFTRSGNTGITIKAINKETGKKETVAFVTFNKNRKGNLVKDAEWANAQQVLEKYQGDSAFEIGEAFDLTKDALLKRLTNKEVTLDILDQMVDIMMKNNQRIGDDQANAVPTWEAIGKILRDDISKKGYDASMKHAQNIDGYRKNWYNILPNHIQGNSYALSNRRYTPALRYALRQGENVTQEEKAYADRYVESLLNPDNDLFQNLRSIQFNWVLGFRPASALIQLTSLTHMMPATLTLMTNNATKAFAIQARAFKESNYFAKLTRDSFYDITPETISAAGKKYGWSEEKQKAVYRAYQDGYLTQTLTFEEVGATPYDTSTWQGKMRKGSEEFTRLGGMLLRSTEELSRLTQFLGMYDALNNPANLGRFHNLVKKDDAQYRAHLQLTNADAPDMQYLLRYGLNNSLALFGKEGRTPFQGTAAQFALPFATYPWQMFMNFYRMARKMGPEGRKAALVATIGTVSTAGIWGLPGFMLLKEGLEAILSLVFEEDIDLDKEIDELAQETFTDSATPWLTPEQAKQISGVARRGLLSTYSSADLNERVGFSALGEQQLIDLKNFLMTGEAPSGAATGMYGVIGGTVAMAPVKAMTKYRDSGGSWVETINELLPQFMKDVIQTNVIEPEKGKSFAGTQTLSADDADKMSNRFLGTMGFKSREEGLREEVARSVSQAEKRLDVYKDAAARKVERHTKDLINALQDPNGDEAMAREQFNDVIAGYINYLSSKNVPGSVIMSSVQRVIKDAQNEALGSRDYDLSNFFKMKQAAKEARDEIHRIHELYKLEE